MPRQDTFINLTTQDHVLHQLLHLLSTKELINVASTCNEWKQAVLSALEPNYKDVSRGLEPKLVPCDVVLQLAVKLIALAKTQATLGRTEAAASW